MSDLIAANASAKTPLGKKTFRPLECECRLFSVGNKLLIEFAFSYLCHLSMQNVAKYFAENTIDCNFEIQLKLGNLFEMLVHFHCRFDLEFKICYDEIFSIGLR